MSVQITGKHMSIGESLSQRIEDRIEAAVAKYFDGGYAGHVTMEKTGGAFECDCTVHLDTGVVLQATARSHEAHSCFDNACERIEKRLRRYKRRLKDHRQPGKSNGKAVYTIMSAPQEEEEITEDYAPAIVAESATTFNTQTVAQAVMQLDLTDNPVIVFTNAASGKTNVVYRRPDGNIGWIDPK
jgi:ribosomal subunit interface protein